MVKKNFFQKNLGNSPQHFLGALVPKKTPGDSKKAKLSRGF